MAIHKLSKTALKTLGDGMHNDGGGLYLRVRGNSRSWVYRFRKNGKLHDVGLGSARSVPVAKARSVAASLREQIAVGKLDGLLGRNVAAAVNPTFGEFKLKAFKNYQLVKRPGRTRYRGIVGSVERFASTLNNKKVVDIRRDDILGVLKPLWIDKTPTAKVLLIALNIVFSYAKAINLIKGELPTQWKGNLDAFLPAMTAVHTEIHRKPIPLTVLPKVFSKAVYMNTASADALVFGILTGLRVAEFSSAKWEDIDFEARVFTAPRTKGKNRAFRVPLAPQTVRWLKGLPRISEYVFSVNTFSPVAASSVRRVMKQLCPDADVHGIRSSFSMWCAENGIDPYVRETCLAHKVDGQVASAYQQSDLLERRRPVMESWCAFVSSSCSSFSPS